MEFPRQGYWSGMSCPPPGDLPKLGIEPMSLTSGALAGRFFTASTTREAPVQETGVQFLDQEDPLENRVTTQSNILAWEIPWTEEPGRLQSMGLQKVGHKWVSNTLTFTHDLGCI